MTDYVLHDLGILLSASRSRSYQQSIYKYTYVLVNFLKSNALLANELPDEIDDSFVIMESDLTNEGRIWADNCLQKWIAKVDKGMPVEDVSILEKELAKIRK